MDNAETVLFVPGFQEGIHSRPYEKVLDAVRSKGYKAEFIPIQWKRTTLKEWAVQLDEVYAGYDPKRTILGGFSFGAMTALLVAAKRNPARLWLFSISGYFTEDAQAASKPWDAMPSIGKRRAQVFAETRFGEAAEDIHSPTLLFLGEQEAHSYPELFTRAQAATKLIRNSRLVMIPDTKHDVTADAYIQTILENI